MTPFTTRTKRFDDPTDRAPVPHGFEALADALLAGDDPGGVVEEIGVRAARDGVPVDEVMSDLSMTYGLLRGVDAEPPFPVIRSMVRTWADASLRHLHSVSCEDPLTGLASLAHIRTRLLELYRESAQGGERGCSDRALMVVELQWPAAYRQSSIDRSVRLIDIAELLRTVFAGEEAIGQVSGSRVVAVVRRDQRVGDAVSSLLGLLQDWQDRTGIATRLWIEGLPASADSAEALLDELAR